MKHYHIRRVSLGDYIHSNLGDRIIFIEDISDAQDFYKESKANYTARCAIGHDTYPTISPEHEQVRQGDLEVISHTEK